MSGRRRVLSLVIDCLIVCPTISCSFCISVWMLSLVGLVLMMSVRVLIVVFA